MIYVDNLFGCQKSAKWPYTSACHLMADSLDELHTFAGSLGLRREWYQPHDAIGHYDLTPSIRAKAVARGAREISTLDEYRQLWNKPAQGKVYPVGYSLSGIDRFIAEQMSSNDSTLLIDIRYKPYSWRAEWTQEALRAKYGARYRWAGAYLGNLNYKQGWPIQIANPEVGIKGLCQYLSEGHDVILLCQCAAYDNCHRKVVVQLLQETMPEVEVVMPRQSIQSDTLKCISIRQPWIWLITHPEIVAECGIPEKDIENREWDTSERGPLLIHAGANVDSDLFTRGQLDDDYWEYKFGHAGAALYARMPQRKEDYIRGAIVGQATLVDVVQESVSPWFRGKYGFVFIDAKSFDQPVPYSGSLKLFDVERSVVSEVSSHV